VHRELADRAKQGDEEAFDALARLVGNRCMGIAHRILRDVHLVEDAVQAALVVAWREMRTLRDPDRFEPWLHRIVTNQCYAEARRRTRWSADTRLLPIDGSATETGILSVNDRDQLERAFRRLMLEQRVAPEPGNTSCNRGVRPWPDPGPDLSGGYSGVPPDAITDLWVVDVGGQRVVVFGRHRPASSAQDVAELNGIVESVAFDPPAASQAP
jgi:hypothetical protein